MTVHSVLESDRAGERGATMLEIALTLPFFLIGIFLVIWIGVVIHGKSSLDAAVTKSLRLAATRGVNELLGVSIISDVQDWLDSGAVNPSSRLQGLLATEEWDQAGPYYDELVSGVFSGKNLSDLPPEYIYALVYVNESMRQSVGPSLRSPCDPNDLANGGGCMACSFLDPVSYRSAFDEGTATSDDPPRRTMGLECRYQPAHFLLRPLVSLLAMIGGSTAAPLIVLKKRMFFDIPEF